MNAQYKKGIAIFIAVVAVSALLLIALALADISYKEQTISFTSRESKVAFYAADTGIECALFHDFGGGQNADDPFLFSTTSPAVFGTLACANQSIDVSDANIVTGTNQATTTFFFNISESPKSCAVVRVSKFLSDGAIKTKIESRGYNNTCTGTVDDIQLTDNNQRNLERAFRMTY